MTTENVEPQPDEKKGRAALDHFNNAMSRVAHESLSQKREVWGRAPVNPEVQERTIAEYKRILNTEKLPIGVESDLVTQFLVQHRVGFYEDTIPMGPNDRIVREMALKYGRADLVVYHQDGSVSVIEAKNGSKGYNHVVSGIGQAGLYATQIAFSGVSFKKVRKCLMWTSTGSVYLDSLISLVCDDANVVPIPWMGMKDLIALRMAAIRSCDQQTEVESPNHE